MPNASGKKRISLGKILFFIGVTGIVISLALIFSGIFYGNNVSHVGYLCLSIGGFIGIVVSFISIVAGAAGWYLESFADKIRANKREAGDSQPQ